MQCSSFPLNQPQLTTPPPFLIEISSSSSRRRSTTSCRAVWVPGCVWANTLKSIDLDGECGTADLPLNALSAVVSKCSSESIDGIHIDLHLLPLALQVLFVLIAPGPKSNDDLLRTTSH